MATRKKSGRRAARETTPPVATEEIISESGSEPMEEQNGFGLMDAATPILGLVAGGFVATKGARIIGVPEKWAPWGVAAIGTYAAMTGSGWVRQAGVGAAAAGVTLGLLETMGMLDFLAAIPTMRRQAAVTEPPTPSAPPDAITRDDLQRSLSDLARKNDAQLKERTQQHVEQLRELRSTYDIRIDQICASYNQRLAEKDQTISELLRELRKANASGPSIVHRDATPRIEEALPSEPEAPADYETAAAADETATPPAADETATLPATDEATASEQSDVVTRAQAIRERLSPDENRQLQQLLMTASPERVAFAEAQVANLSPDDAVAFLREHVLAAPNAA
jgi:hypothetical protein